MRVGTQRNCAPGNGETGVCICNAKKVVCLILDNPRRSPVSVQEEFVQAPQNRDSRACLWCQCRKLRGSLILVDF